MHIYLRIQCYRYALSISPTSSLFSFKHSTSASAFVVFTQFSTHFHASISIEVISQKVRFISQRKGVHRVCTVTGGEW